MGYANLFLPHTFGCAGAVQTHSRRPDITAYCTAGADGLLDGRGLDALRSAAGGHFP